MILQLLMNCLSKLEEGIQKKDPLDLILTSLHGMPLAFLKHPNNSGGIQVEFDRMINKRLKNDDYRKYSI